MVNLYSKYRCCKCSSRAEGVFYDPDPKYDIWNITYYCSVHFNIRKSAEDKKQAAAEYEMYKDKEWYQKLFPEKFFDRGLEVVKKTEKQLKLF